MKNTFEITSWDEVPYLELGGEAKHSRATIKKKYSGIFNGEATLEYLMAYDQSGAAQFTGIEYFNGNIDKRQGTVSLIHNGTFSNGVVASWFEIINGSQTGELLGLEAQGNYKTGHSLTVGFTLDLISD